jgi:hypothetical protein
LKKNEDFVIAKRTAMKEKSLKNISALLGSFDAQFAPGEQTPLEKERAKIIQRRTDYYKNKIQAALAVCIF